MPLRNWRSALFVPASNPALCAKAARSGADAVIIDLEDGVPVADKAEARERVADAAKALAAANLASIVRINADWLTAVEDLKAAVAADVTAVMIPKVEDHARLRVIDAMLGELESDGGSPATGVIALVETPAGVLALERISECPRMIGLALGTEDYSAVLGVPAERTLLELPSRMIAMAAAGRMMALAVPFSIARFADVEHFGDAATAAAGFGVTGALCIHPRQVRIANEAFAPRESRIAEARQILAAWDAAQRRGEAVVNYKGTMIDRLVALRAQHILAGIEDRGRQTSRSSTGAGPARPWTPAGQLV